jgi:hypothetical protein
MLKQMKEKLTLNGETKKNVEGFYTNLNFPNSTAATRTNVNSDAVYESRKLLEVDNELKSEVNELNKLGLEITRGVNMLQGTSNRFIGIAQELETSEEQLKVTNLVINRLYSKAELDQNVRSIAFLANWAFDCNYLQVPKQPNSTQGFYRKWKSPFASLTYPSMDPTLDPASYYYNQQKKLTYKEALEYCAQTGSLAFGLTDAQIDGTEVRSTLLVPIPDDATDTDTGYGLANNYRNYKITKLNDKRINLSFKFGNYGNTPVYKLMQSDGESHNYTPPRDEIPGFTFKGTYKDARGAQGIRTMSYMGMNGTLFDAAREAKLRGFKYFSVQFAGLVFNNGGQKTDKSFRSGQLWGSNDWSKITSQGQAGSAAVTYGPETGPAVQSSVDAPYYDKTYILGAQNMNAVYELDDDETFNLSKEGDISLETVVNVPQAVLSTMTISKKNINKLNRGADGNIVGLLPFIRRSMSIARERGLTYIGFYCESTPSSMMNFKSFGTVVKTPNYPQEPQIEPGSTEISEGENIIVDPEQGTQFGKKNVIVSYILYERLKDGGYWLTRPYSMLNEIAYIDDNSIAHKFPEKMKKPKDVRATQYKVMGNTKSDYFNDNEISRVETLQDPNMSIPKCRDICNKYYDRCAGFSFVGDARTVDGNIEPQCSIKSIDPTTFSFGTEERRNAKLYLKVPQIGSNYTCPKRVTFAHASYLFDGWSMPEVEGGRELMDSSKFNLLSDNGEEITPFTIKNPMTPKLKCNAWSRLEKDSEEMRRIQNEIASKIDKYGSVVDKLKKYHSDLNIRAELNKPKVDEAVKKFHDIIDRIGKYAELGDFRSDKQKAVNSIISRKSYVYIYTLWLTVAVIIVIFAFMTLYKLGK